MRCLFSKRT